MPSGWQIKYISLHLLFAVSQKVPMEIYQKNGLYGLKNDCGEVIVTPQYREFLTIIMWIGTCPNIKYQYTYISQENQFIVPFGNYMWLDHIFTCGYARVIQYSVIENKQYWGIIGVVSNDNNTLIPVISIVCNSAGKIFCLLHHKKILAKKVKQAMHLAQTKHI